MVLFIIKVVTSKVAYFTIAESELRISQDPPTSPPHGFILSECSLKPSGVILFPGPIFHFTMDSDEIVEPPKEEDLDQK